MSGPSSRPIRARAVALGGLLYFVVVFACGFVLGVARTLWVAPRLGERWAELVELPLMVVVSFLAARWIVQRSELADSGPGARTALGVVALALLLVAEAGMVLLLRGQSLGEYALGRDPVSGTGYLLSLVLFALLPALVSRRSAAR